MEGARKAKQPLLEETSRTYLWTAFENPSKARFSTRNTSHVFADERPLPGLSLFRCKLLTNRYNTYGGSFELRKDALSRRQRQAKGGLPKIETRTRKEY